MTELTFSPLDGRYAKDLPFNLSEQATLEFQVQVEKAWLLELMAQGLCPKVSEKELDKIFAGISFSEIEAIEARTQHATRALIEVLMERLQKAKKEKVAHWVHVGLTSFDTVDTAARLRLKSFVINDFVPQLEVLKSELKRFAKAFGSTLAVGRTHGQWAVPTYFGLQFAEAHERIEILEKKLLASTDDLRGQASGAIGGYQASSLLFKNPLEVEAKYLKRLGLKPHYSSTQILPPEDMVEVGQFVVSIASVAAKLATDLRHLARSEIVEVVEGMGKGQVGSSTMPQKRNPWNLEHVCSLFKVLLSRFSLMQMDVVSEHQRDLTNSASGRFYMETFSVAFLMIFRLAKVLQKLEAFPQQMRKHLESASSSVYAEAFYVLGTMEGHADAHDRVREAARKMEKSGQSLLEVLNQEKFFKKKKELKDIQKEILKGSELKLKSITKAWGK